ncbi:AGRG5 protein, partial [Pterocles burchelli]|nr:AGRG5 protein [Pterocles burchelli]
DGRNSSVLNNHVLGAFLQHRRVAGLSRPVEIHFGHDTMLPPSDDGSLAGMGSTGSWSHEGCKTTHREGTVICHCNHLTYFAVLLLASLTHLTTIGCSLSTAATLGTLLLCCFSSGNLTAPRPPHSCRQRPRDNSTRIHMHLLAALLLLNCSFLLSTLLAAGTEELCQVTATLLHTGLLCTLAWMGAEAFHLLLLFVKVYNIYIQHYLLKLHLFAWGEWSPAWPCVRLSLARLPQHGPTQPVLGGADPCPQETPPSARCWLASQPAHYATLGYTGLILLFNTLVLGRVVMILRRMQWQKGQARKDCMTVLGLTCLLGTTWGLAFFNFGIFLVPQLYLFTILNSLQG